MKKTVLTLGLSLLLAASAYVVYEGWTAHSGGIELPDWGLALLGVGAMFGLVIGCGLMALAFYSSRRGYVVVVQDVRGRFESEGRWDPFRYEAEFAGGSPDRSFQRRRCKRHRAVFLRERVDRSTAPWPSENAKLCEHCLADGDALGSIGRCRHVNIQ